MFSRYCSRTTVKSCSNSEAVKRGIRPLRVGQKGQKLFRDYLGKPPCGFLPILLTGKFTPKNSSPMGGDTGQPFLFQPWKRFRSGGVAIFFKIDTVPSQPHGKSASTIGSFGQD